MKSGAPSALSKRFPGDKMFCKGRRRQLRQAGGRGDGQKVELVMSAGR